MPVRPQSPFQARYEAEVRALAEHARSMMHGLSQLAGACDEALAKGGQVNPGNAETTISTSHRSLLKQLGIVTFLQSTGAEARRPGSCAAYNDSLPRGRFVR